MALRELLEELGIESPESQGDSGQPLEQSQTTEVRSQIEDDANTDVFLGYSRQDQQLMERLRKDLRKNQLSVWTDDIDLEPGTPDWQAAIEDALASHSRGGRVRSR